MSESNIGYEMTRNFYFGECLDSDDPLMLGRIRARLFDENIEQRKKAANDFDENGSSTTNGPWSDKDPFIFLPFLPYFINQVPRVKEQCVLFYFDRTRRSGRNKFYMMGPFSSPMTIKYEDYRSSQTNLDSGRQNSNASLPNIKNSNGVYYDVEKTGVFTEPFDISLNGRDTSDIILKERDILLRAGKHLPFVRGEVPFPNERRAFLQMSYFDKLLNYEEPVTYQKLERNNESIKYLIEYQCSTKNTNADSFTGMIIIYKIDPSPFTQTDFFDWETQLTGVTPQIIYTKTLTALPLDKFASEINKVIVDFQQRPFKLFNTTNNIVTTSGTSTVTTGVTEITTATGFDSVEYWASNPPFPFFYRPDIAIRKTITDFLGNVDTKSVENMAKLLQKVEVSVTTTQKGYGLVNDKENGIRSPFRGIDETVIPITTNVIDNTCTLMGAETLYFLSHLETIPGKEKVDLSNSIYGISANTVFEQILPNTSSMVRGEELMELLRLIVNFLITHDHPYPQLPPTPIAAASNISTQDLLTTLQEAYQKVLNKNIRIN